MEMILVSHVYNAITATRSIDVAQFYFEYRRNTKKRDAKDHFDVPVALGLLSRPDADSLVAQQGPGRSALRAETRYDSKESWSLFAHSDGALRSLEEFEKAGREAVMRLEGVDEEDDARKVLAISDELFGAMRAAGSFGNAQLILRNVTHNGKHIPESLYGAIYSDYLGIRWWSDSMVALGAALKSIIDYESKSTDPAALKTDNEYLNLRKELRKQSADVAKKTKARFGEPWGLIAMDLIGHPKTASVQITTDADVYHYDRSQPSAVSDALGTSASG
jgi:hypothetical protein